MLVLRVLEIRRRKHQLKTMRTAKATLFYACISLSLCKPNHDCVAPALYAHASIATFREAREEEYLAFSRIY